MTIFYDDIKIENKADIELYLKGHYEKDKLILYDYLCEIGLICIQ